MSAHRVHVLVDTRGTAGRESCVMFADVLCCRGPVDY